jgi:hypothetical protein
MAALILMRKPVFSGSGVGLYFSTYQNDHFSLEAPNFLKKTFLDP